jgi:hypothetical protein
VNPQPKSPKEINSEKTQINKIRKI